MSAVCMCTSSLAGSAMSGSGTSRGRRIAAVAAAAIIVAGVERVQLGGGEPGDRLLHHHPLGALKNGPPSAVVCWSPVISTTGAAQAERDQPVDPALPAFGAVQLAPAISTDGLYVCDSTELSPEIDPW